MYATRPHGFAYMCWMVSCPSSNARFGAAIPGGPNHGARDCRMNSVYGPGACIDSKTARFCSLGSLRYLSSAWRYVGTQARSAVSVSVRYRPTTSMSVVAGASVKDCDTTRTGGAEACGGWVGTRPRGGVGGGFPRGPRAGGNP